MSEPLFVLSAGALAGVLYCSAHAIMQWWYRRKARHRFYHMAQKFERSAARPWWVVDDKEQER